MITSPNVPLKIQIFVFRALAIARQVGLATDNASGL